ncbi:glutathione S-transferase family protein [Acuticoccus sp. I52.16.1]|uniref:glutathione S-transferase family protein n=1 Tax=Acuticoccus sp. I52.16.1 TaxID=2928472 RepID=UPI001FD4C509|nr:glutathione S-transferase family protein [Acuticoccus sp. I52.16.1]UOM34120.1 glutathione S-transferase family protein [Acuticoccus sp. I52.16.1]
MKYTIVIGNKNYSSWSMRPWLVLDHFGLAYEEVMVPLDMPETRPTILEHSPAGKVPVLLDGGFAVWDSMAIIEYLAERHPDLPIWPAELQARSRARSLAMEMHAGFAGLRTSCPMNLKVVKRFKHRGGSATARDVARFEAMVRDRLARSGGPFLFGEWTAVDAMYAPVAARLTGYSWPMEGPTRAYVEAVQGEASYRKWRAAGLEETWVHPRVDKA